ncbi:MAG TPA: hypothetical protein VJ835_05200 [Fimbriimonadaceae bacterium]|nr:hypothetical protein [Fimbriimonadaceae bacterium]
MQLRKAVPVHLMFDRLLTSKAGRLQLSEEVSKLDGKWVQAAGFMVQMENPSKGGFWLAAQSIHVDESGAGIGDLPPNAIFVRVAGAGDKPVAFLGGKLLVVGKLRLSNTFPKITIQLQSEMAGGRR